MTKLAIHDVILNTDELMLLDGQCRPEIQARIDACKSGEIAEPAQVKVGGRILDTDCMSWSSDEHAELGRKLYGELPQAMGLATVVSTGDMRGMSDKEGTEGVLNGAAIVYDIEPGIPYFIEAVLDAQFKLASACGLGHIEAPASVRESFKDVQRELAQVLAEAAR